LWNDSQVTDVAALAFSASFYQALALGTTFEQASLLLGQRVELEARDEAQLLKCSSEREEFRSRNRQLATVHWAESIWTRRIDRG